MTTGPLHGPPTFAEWLRTCTVEVFLDGPAWTVEVLPEPAFTVEVLAADLFTRVRPAPDARRAALCRWSAAAATGIAPSTPGRTGGAIRTADRRSIRRRRSRQAGRRSAPRSSPRSRSARSAEPRRPTFTTYAGGRPGTARTTSRRCADGVITGSPAGRRARRGRDDRVRVAVTIGFGSPRRSGSGGRRLALAAPEKAKTWVSERLAGRYPSRTQTFEVPPLPPAPRGTGRARPRGARCGARRACLPPRGPAARPKGAEARTGRRAGRVVLAGPRIGSCRLPSVPVSQRAAAARR
jgi:hypothetical protein